MSVRRTSAVLGLLALALPAWAAAQGLGDTAAREREKRAKQAREQKAEAQVFTNDDLAAGRPPGATPSDAPSGSAPAPEATRGEEPASAEPDRLTQERPYIEAIRSAQEHVAATEARIRGLSEKLNPMSGSFIYGAQGSNSANEEAQVRQGLREAEAQLLEAREGLAAASQGLEDFRRGRIPSSSEPR
jgi:hypothetical protein